MKQTNKHTNKNLLWVSDCTCGDRASQPHRPGRLWCPVWGRSPSGAAVSQSPKVTLLGREARQSISYWCLLLSVFVLCFVLSRSFSSSFIRPFVRPLRAPQVKKVKREHDWTGSGCLDRAQDHSHQFPTARIDFHIAVKWPHTSPRSHPSFPSRHLPIH